MANILTDRPTLDVLDAISLRHSVRSFKPDPIPEEVLLTLLESARQAPSSYNLQPWEFVVVTSPDAKQKLGTGMADFNQKIVNTAGASFVCLGSMRRQDELADQLEKTWRSDPDMTPAKEERIANSMRRLREDTGWRREHVLTNTYIGIAQLVLAAQRFGLGTLWMGGFDGDAVKRALDVPDDYLVASVVSVGWPAEELKPEPRHRRQLEEIYYTNRFGQRG